MDSSEAGAAIIYAPAASGDTAPIPYEKADRTPVALQHLESMTSDVISMDAAWLVSVCGEITDHGAAAIFGQLRERGGPPHFRLYRVVSYDSRNRRFSHASRIDGSEARRLYDQRIQELT